MASNGCGGVGEQAAEGLFVGEFGLAELPGVEGSADGVDGLDGDAVVYGFFLADEDGEAVFEGGGEGVGEGGEQDAGVGVFTGEAGGAVEGDDGFAGTGRAGDAGGAFVVAFDNVALGGVEEDGPLFPRVIEGGGELFGIGHDAEAALGVGVSEGVCAWWHRDGGLRCAAGGEQEEGFRGFGGESLGHIEDGVFRCMTDVGEPFSGDAVGEKLFVFEAGE